MQHGNHDAPEGGPGILTTEGTDVRQISIFLENRVGSLLSIVRLINENQVVVLGISVQESIDVTVVRLVLSDPDTIESLFIEKGIPYSTSALLVVELKESLGGLATCLHELLCAELNIHFIYPLITRPNENPVLALRLDDTDFGRGVLHQAGFKLLSQEDLSR